MTYSFKLGSVVLDENTDIKFNFFCAGDPAWSTVVNFLLVRANQTNWDPLFGQLDVAVGPDPGIPLKITTFTRTLEEDTGLARIVETTAPLMVMFSPLIPGYSSFSCIRCGANYHS